MDQLAYLIAAYAVVWLGVVGYLAWLRSQVGALRREIEAVGDLLGEPADR